MSIGDFVRLFDAEGCLAPARWNPIPALTVGLLPRPWLELLRPPPSYLLLSNGLFNLYLSLLAKRTAELRPKVAFGPLPKGVKFVDMICEIINLDDTLVECARETLVDKEFAVAW